MRMFYDEDVINLNHYSFEQWIVFVFDHPAPEWQGGKPIVPRAKAWYWQDEWDHWGTSEHLLPYMTRLFRKPDFLLERYSTEQLRQGLWYISGGGRCDDWIWDTDVAWKLRKKCILAMVPLFERLFIKEQLHDTCYMWWDFFRNYRRKQDAKVKEVMLLALSQILLLPSQECQAAALHGLGHLNYPRKSRVIRKFLASHPELNEEWRTFAAAAITGKVL